MILRRYMSLLGIGAAKIDLRLDKTHFQSGECVTGFFHIKGGTIEQQVKRIECDLVMRNELEDKEEVIETFTIYTSQMIESEAHNKLDFRLTLPLNLTQSSANVIYRFKTRMIFDEGVKSEDQDRIFIK